MRFTGGLIGRSDGDSPGPCNCSGPWTPTRCTRPSCHLLPERHKRRESATHPLCMGGSGPSRQSFNDMRRVSLPIVRCRGQISRVGQVHTYRLERTGTRCLGFRQTHTKLLVAHSFRSGGEQRTIPAASNAALPMPGRDENIASPMGQKAGHPWPAPLAGLTM